MCEGEVGLTMKWMMKRVALRAANYYGEAPKAVRRAQSTIISMFGVDARLHSSLDHIYKAVDIILGRVCHVGEL